MTGLIRKIVLLGSCGLFMVSLAGASAPDPAYSTVPRFIDVGGMTSQTNPVPDPSLAFTISVRDVAGPIAGSVVEVNFANCSDTYLCTAVISGQAVDCSGGNKRVIATTDNFGQVTLSILGAGKHIGAVPPASFPGAGADCISVYADDPSSPGTQVLLGMATSVLYDKQGARPNNDGVSGADLSYLINDIGSAPWAYRGRSDHNHDGIVNGSDVSRYAIGIGSILGQSILGVGSGAGCFGSGPNGPNSRQPYCP